MGNGTSDGNRSAATAPAFEWRHPFPTRQKSALALRWTLGLSMLFLLLLGPGVARDAWVAATWPSAEASIVGDPQNWPPERHPALPGDELELALQDGRIVTGRSRKPLQERLGAPEYRTRRMEPGDRVKVHYRYGDPTQMVVRDELASRSPVALTTLAFFATVALLNLREILRRRRTAYQALPETVT